MEAAGLEDQLLPGSSGSHDDIMAASSGGQTPRVHQMFHCAFSSILSCVLCLAVAPGAGGSLPLLLLTAGVKWVNKMESVSRCKDRHEGLRQKYGK